MTSEPVPSRAEGTVIHTLGAERRDRVQLPVNLNCAPAPGTQGRRGRGGSRRGRRHRGSLGRASRPLVPQACPFHGAHRRFLMNDLLSFPISLNSAPTPACGSSSHLKSTPAATPCTPRRLSLAESFTNARESTTTMSTSLGLVWLLKERGISAAVYDPQSWNRAGGGPLLHSYTPRMAVIPSTLSLSSSIYSHNKIHTHTSRQPFPYSGKDKRREQTPVWHHTNTVTLCRASCPHSHSHQSAHKQCA